MLSDDLRSATVPIVDYYMFSVAVILTVVGLVFTASGFGIFVVGRFEGVIIIVIGLSMFWGGWSLSEAKSFPCATAALLNMLDAASTVVFWSLEINPIALTLGPALFLTAKITASLAILLYAKLHPNPRRGGTLLSLFFASIVGWNLSQNLSAHYKIESLQTTVLLGALLSFTASAIVLYIIYITEKIQQRQP